MKISDENSRNFYSSTKLKINKPYVKIFKSYLANNMNFIVKQ